MTHLIHQRSTYPIIHIHRPSIRPHSIHPTLSSPSLSLPWHPSSAHSNKRLRLVPYPIPVSAPQPIRSVLAYHRFPRLSPPFATNQTIQEQARQKEHAKLKASISEADTKHKAKSAKSSNPDPSTSPTKTKKDDQGPATGAAGEDDEIIADLQVSIRLDSSCTATMDPVTLMFDHHGYTNELLMTYNNCCEK